MLKVGLTGSIAVGKSFVCDVLAELGCRVLDADKTSRDVVKPGTEGLERVVEEFGAGVLAEDGTLDRKKLGSIVFGDPEKRELLNTIIHPLVITRQDKWLSEQEEGDPHGIAVIDAALMIESGGYKRFDQLIVVWCEADVQLRRLMDRDKLTEIEARKRIEAQMPQAEKKQFADHLINTSFGFEDTRRQTEEVFRLLSGLK
jgi:dephospho-CoA kinase